MSTSSRLHKLQKVRYKSMLSTRWHEAGNKVRQVLIDLKHNTTCIDRVYRNISTPAGEELDIGVTTENELVMANDVLTMVEMVKAKIEAIYNTKIANIRCIRVSNKAPNQIASVTIIVKFVESVWECK